MYYTGGTECLNAFHFPLISPQISFFPASGKILKNTQHWFSPDEIDSIWREKKKEYLCTYIATSNHYSFARGPLSPSLGLQSAAEGSGGAPGSRGGGGTNPGKNGGGGGTAPPRAGGGGGGYGASGALVSTVGVDTCD